MNDFFQTEPMIDELQALLPEVHSCIRDSLEKWEDQWDSLVINKRKPHTHRVHRMFGNRRVCLHRFSPCEDEDVFSHPHGWPAAFLVLKGEYIHTLGCSNTLSGDDAHAEPRFIYREVVRPYSMYEIVNPFTWHRVQPTETTYTIMMNGAEFEHKHEQTRTTKGKDLDKMEVHYLMNHLTMFDVLLTEYLRKHP